MLASSHPQFDLLSSMLLSAFHAKSSVRFYVDGCAGSYMNLVAVSIFY